MIKVGIVGATGYTGQELLRLLINHPEVSIHCITSRSEAGKAVEEIFPNLRHHLSMTFVAPDITVLRRCDVVFFATPHQVAMSMVPQLMHGHTRIIDLSADFRLRDPAQWAHWYHCPHQCPELLADAVYGLPEVNRDIIKKASLIAVPGCYPTATQLGFLPLVESNLVDSSQLIADVKSGISGAGRKAAIPALLAEAAENMTAYAASGHRHLPEICQGLNAIGQQEVTLTFIPHLTPMVRGIHATLYATLTQDIDLQQHFEQRYANEPYVDVLPAGTHPGTKSVSGTNLCRISVIRPQNQDRVVVLSVIDNLVKGAAGQAIQNMNIMFNLPETTALNTIATMP